NKIVSLYRNPPKDGVVICVDEMGPLACIPRGGRGWGKKPARRPDRYHRSNTIQLLAAFAPHAGHAVGIPSANKTGEVVLAFLQDTVLRVSAQTARFTWYGTTSVLTNEPSACGSLPPRISSSSGLPPTPLGST